MFENKKLNKEIEKEIKRKDLQVSLICYRIKIGIQSTQKIEKLNDSIEKLRATIQKGYLFKYIRNV